MRVAEEEFWKIYQGPVQTALDFASLVEWLEVWVDREVGNGKDLAKDKIVLEFGLKKVVFSNWLKDK